MPCYQSTNLPPGFSTTGRTSYATEADCLNACKDGACCEGTTCTVKPACQCQGTGKVFRGVGTVCTASLCGCCGNSETIAGKTATLYVSTESMPVLRWCPQVSGGTTFLQCPDGLQYGECWAVKPCETPAIGAWVDTAFSASATFINNTPASSCSASLQGQCLADTRPASVFLSASPCKIYAIAECPGLVGVFVSGSSLMPYFAWDYDPLISEYNATYYVFQYTGGSGQSTATQSVNATPVPPPQTGFTWSLFKTVTLSMRLTLV
jgi:hypothetical protein